MDLASPAVSGTSVYANGLIALSTFRDILFNLQSSWYAFVRYFVATTEIYRDVLIHFDDAVWRCG